MDTLTGRLAEMYDDDVLDALWKLGGNDSAEYKIALKFRERIEAYDAAKSQIAESKARKTTMTGDERAWRTGWAFAYSGPTHLYGDDGELQDNRFPMIDWMRDSAIEIQSKIHERGLAAYVAAKAQPEQPAIGPIESGDMKGRAYIPLPGGWEVQTKGSGSTFRLCNTKDGDRLAIPDSPYLYETLERMAREIHAAALQQPTVTLRPITDEDARKIVETYMCPTISEEVRRIRHGLDILLPHGKPEVKT